MNLKTVDINGTTYAEVLDGKPVYESEDGKLIPFDAPHTGATVKRLNAEAKAHREAKEQAEAKLKLYEGLDDPVAARKALETVRSLEGKKVVDDGDLERVKREAKDAFDRQFETTYRPVEQERDALRAQLHSERLGAAFSRSKFIADKLAIPADIVQARFGSSFAIEDGKVIAKGADGHPIFSRAKPGDPADFDEALEILVDSYPHRDSILKGTGASGGGSGSYRTGSGGKRQVTRAQLAAMEPAEKAKVSREAEIVD